MTTVEPTGIGVYSPKIRDQALVRKFVSQNGTGYVAINIFDGTQSVDPDPGTIALTVWFNDVTAEFPTTSDPRGTIIITADSTQIQQESVGHYFYDIGPQHTQYRGVLTAEWTYAVNGTSFTFYDYLQILEQMPFYETCSDQEKSTVERVSWMIGDLFDSTEGGPYLIEPFQTHWNYERIAQLEAIAVTRFNYLAFPVTSYGVGSGGGQSLPVQFSDIAVIGTYLEVVRHFMRSYAEIPAFVGMNVTYTDRRDYMQRWGQILQTEEAQYEQMVKYAKRSLLQLGRGSILVSGGLYGPSAGLFITSMYSSQVRAFRFYPASFAIAFGMVK
jgi:hypothetical protein